MDDFWLLIPAFLALGVSCGGMVYGAVRLLRVFGSSSGTLND